MLLVAVAPDVLEIERRLEAGDSVNAIAADLGVTARTIRNRLHAAGLPLASIRSLERRRRFSADPVWLRDQYLDQGRGPYAIAKSLGLPTAEVNAALERFGIERQPTHPELGGEALRAAFASGETVSSIARRVGIDRSGVRQRMRRHGIENPHADRGRRPALLDDPDWLRRRYVDDRRSMKAIGAEVGADGATVGRALRRHGIERPAGIGKRIDLDPAWLEQAYAVDRLPVAEIARRAGVGVVTINRRRAEYGIPNRPRLSAPKGQARPRRNSDQPGGLDPDWLRRRYVDERATIVQLGREAGVSATTVHRALRFHGLTKSR